MGWKNGVASRCTVAFRACEGPFKLVAGDLSCDFNCATSHTIKLVPILYLGVSQPYRDDSDYEAFEPVTGIFRVSSKCVVLNLSEMRRAVRDYKYEVNESRMTEECSQYLAQLQKDWERHRVKLGVDAMRKEVRYESLFNPPNLFSSRH